MMSPLPAPELDSTIHNNENAKHFNIGGHIFAGAYPINNPVPSGDTGYVYLYRIIGNNIIAVDTTNVTTFGYFTFSYIVQGEYLLKAGLTKGSFHYNQFFPTYYTNALKWNVSDHLLLADSNRFEVNIHLNETTSNISGPASMSGFVMQTLKDASAQKMTNAEIVLLNDVFSPLIFSFSDANGKFSFSNLPYGIYYLLVESTGKYPLLLKVVLDENHPNINNLILEVFTHAPMNIEEVEFNGIEVSLAYPNPTYNNINLKFRSGEPAIISLETISMTGEKLFSTLIEVSGTKTYTLPLTNYSSGVLFLSLKSLDGKWSNTQKIYKK